MKGGVDKKIHFVIIYLVCVERFEFGYTMVCLKLNETAAVATK